MVLDEGGQFATTAAVRGIWAVPTSWRGGWRRSAAPSSRNGWRGLFVDESGPAATGCRGRASASDRQQRAAPGAVHYGSNRHLPAARCVPACDGDECPDADPGRPGAAAPHPRIAVLVGCRRDISGKVLRRGVPRVLRRDAFCGTRASAGWPASTRKMRPGWRPSALPTAGDEFLYRRAAAGCFPAALRPHPLCAEHCQRTMFRACGGAGLEEAGCCTFRKWARGRRPSLCGRAVLAPGLR